MSIPKISADTAYLKYFSYGFDNKPINKSYLQLNNSRYHVYEIRNIFTWIGYVLKKYFSFGHWQERSLVIGTKQHTFLVQTSNASDIDRGIKDLAAEILDIGIPLTRDERRELKQVAISTKQMNSVAHYADHLRSLHEKYGNNDEAIIKLYDNFLREFTDTPLDEEITLNGLHVRAMTQNPITLKQAIHNAEVLYKQLEDSNDDMQKAKAVIFRKNLETFKLLNAEALKDDTSLFNVKVSVLQNPQTYSFANGKRPNYLKEEFKPKAGFTFEATGAFFDYKNFMAGGNDKDFATADFANAFLGGGGLRHGAVQEEIQMLEFAEFPILMACFPSPIKPFSSALSTRNPNDSKAFSNRNLAGQGSPDPLKIEGFTRCLHVTGYGKTVFEKPIHNIDPPQANVSIVAAAAPLINPEEKYNSEVLEDAFNTIFAEMALKKELAQDPANVSFSSGRIGAGVFNNDIEAIYLLHRLAAEHVGIHLKLFAYDKESEIVKGYERSWIKLRQEFDVGNSHCLSLEQCVAKIADHLKSNESEKNEQKAKEKAIAEAEAEKADAKAKEAEAKAKVEAEKAETKEQPEEAKEGPKKESTMKSPPRVTECGVLVESVSEE